MAPRWPRQPAADLPALEGSGGKPAAAGHAAATNPTARQHAACSRPRAKQPARDDTVAVLSNVFYLPQKQNHSGVPPLHPPLHPFPPHHDTIHGCSFDQEEKLSVGHGITTALRPFKRYTEDGNKVVIILNPHYKGFWRNWED